jgi:hypothetical protein
VIFYTTRLLIICGQMFRQQRVEAGMLEFWIQATFALLCFMTCC